MVRRSFMMVLAVCLLLTQSAAVLGHAHAGLRLKGHDPRSHIHTTTHGCGHNHAEQDEDDGEDEQDAASQQHDDTVLLSIADSLAGERGNASFQTEASADWIVSNDCVFSRPQSNIISRPRGSLHPPDHACPIYVRHLALLI